MSASWIKKMLEDNGRLHKEDVLKQAHEAAILGSENANTFLCGFKACYNPYETFGVKQIPDSVGITGAENPWEDFFDLLQELSDRRRTGNDAREAIQEMSYRFDSDEWNMFLAPILRRDMRCGVSATTFNKILEKTHYEIPVFSCQLATNSEGRPEMKGIKRLEPKLDGCLSSDWIIEFDDGTKVTIKEVVDNKLTGKVKSFNTLTGKIEYNEITGWASDGKDESIGEYEWFELELENGKVLPPLTGNHLIYLPKLKCYRRVDLLKEGDQILEDI